MQIWREKILMVILEILFVYYIFLFVLRKFLEIMSNSWNFEKCAILSDLLKASLLLTVRQ